MRGGLLIAALLVPVAVGACQSQADYESQVRSRWLPYVGLTMADFMHRTGLTPHNAFETDGGRTFVVDGPPVTYVVPPAYGLPAIARTDTCRLMIETVSAIDAGTADAWRIVRITTTGPCG